MFHIALFEPEIPPNTGNIIRLCANTGSTLHLVEPLGFSLDDKRMKRAGLDYHEYAQVQLHPTLKQLTAAFARDRIFACSTKGRQRYDQIHFRPGDLLLFGPETRGLPDSVLGELPEQQCLRVPMLAGNRSLNLANAVAVIVYEAWRQQDFGE